MAGTKFVSIPAHIELVPLAVEELNVKSTEPLSLMDASLLETALAYQESRDSAGVAEYAKAMSTEGLIRAYGNLLAVAMELSLEVKKRFDQ